MGLTNERLWWKQWRIRDDKSSIFPYASPVLDGISGGGCNTYVALVPGECLLYPGLSSHQTGLPVSLTPKFWYNQLLLTQTLHWYGCLAVAKCRVVSQCYLVPSLFHYLSKQFPMLSSLGLKCLQSSFFDDTENHFLCFRNI